MQTHDEGNEANARVRKMIWVVAAAVLMFPAVAGATDVTVDCSGNTPGAFTSLQTAINSLDLTGPHTITMIGPCTENVNIVNRERITIECPAGGCFVHSAVGTDDVAIRIVGSRNIRMIQLGANDGAIGVQIARSSELILAGMTIENNLFAGVNLTEGSSARISACTMQNNTGLGLQSAFNSTATIDTAVFTGNGGAGIRCAHGGFCNILGSVDSHHNGGPGLDVFSGGRARVLADGAANSFRSNATGVLIDHGSSAVFFGDGVNTNSVQNNVGTGIDVRSNSTLDLLDTTVSGNTQQGVFVRRLSTAEFGVNNAFAANGGAALACDTTSLLSGTLTGISPIDCLRIERTAGPPRPGKIR